MNYLKEYLFEVFLILGTYSWTVLLPFFIFIKWKKDSFTHRKILDRDFNQNLKAAINNSLKTGIIILFFHIMLFVSEKYGLTRFYQDFDSVSLLGHLLVIAPIILFHDAYFYFSHLLMHRVPILMKFHVVHHQDKNPTPISTLNFHPVEGAIQFLYFLIVPFIVPMHKGD